MSNERADDRVTLTDLSERSGLNSSLITRLIREDRLTVVGTRGRFRVVSAEDAALVIQLAGVARRSGLQLAVLLDAIRSGAARWNSRGDLVIPSGDRDTGDDLEDDVAA